MQVWLKDDFPDFFSKTGEFSGSGVHFRTGGTSLKTHTFFCCSNVLDSFGRSKAKGVQSFWVAILHLATPMASSMLSQSSALKRDRFVAYDVVSQFWCTCPYCKVVLAIGKLKQSILIMDERTKMLNTHQSTKFSDPMALFLIFLCFSLFLKHAIHLARQKLESNILGSSPITSQQAQNHKKMIDLQKNNLLFWGEAFSVSRSSLVHLSHPEKLSALVSEGSKESASCPRSQKIADQQTTLFFSGGNIWAFLRVLSASWSQKLFWKSWTSRKDAFWVLESRDRNIDFSIRPWFFCWTFADLEHPKRSNKHVFLTWNKQEGTT